MITSPASSFRNINLAIGELPLPCPSKDPEATLAGTGQGSLAASPELVLGSAGRRCKGQSPLLAVCFFLDNICTPLLTQTAVLSSGKCGWSGPQKAGSEKQWAKLQQLSPLTEFEPSSLQMHCAGPLDLGLAYS